MDQQTLEQITAELRAFDPLGHTLTITPEESCVRVTRFDGMQARCYTLADAERLTEHERVQARVAWVLSHLRVLR